MVATVLPALKSWISCWMQNFYQEKKDKKRHKLQFCTKFVSYLQQ